MAALAGARVWQPSRGREGIQTWSILQILTKISPLSISNYRTSFPALPCIWGSDANRMAKSDFAGIWPQKFHKNPQKGRVDGSESSTETRRSNYDFARNFLLNRQHCSSTLRSSFSIVKLWIFEESRVLSENRGRPCKLTTVGFEPAAFV